MAKCKICNTQSPLISAQLGICLNCIRLEPEKALKISNPIHAKTRQTFNLPAKPPQSPKGIQCGQCANKCKIAKGQVGYCGLVENQDGKLIRHGGTPKKGILQWYYDPLPTNCVSWWFCPGCTGAGYPKYAYRHEAEINYSNLAVFYGSCSTDCLFCQNWHYRNLAQKHKPTISAKQLASKTDAKTSCICFFGGDPTPQVIHALRASRMALQKNAGRVLRICWETNGGTAPALIDQMAQVSLASGGCIKVDLKAYSEEVNLALCGVSNQQTLENFRRLARLSTKRKEPPFLIASTLLVPGYVDIHEIKGLARFIASLDLTIPYTLLAFHPDFQMDDLPFTSREHATQCLKAAQEEGLMNVNVGNLHLLW